MAENGWAVGIPKFDEQHLELHGLVTQLFLAMKAGRSEAHMPSLLRQARLLLTRHFRDEERMMEEHGYPMLALHQAAHREFVALLERLQGYVTVGDRMAAFQLISGLKGTIERHLRTHDRAYVKYYETKGVLPTREEERRARGTPPSTFVV